MPSWRWALASFTHLVFRITGASLHKRATPGKANNQCAWILQENLLFCSSAAVAPWSVSEMSPWRLTSFEMSSSFSCRVVVFWSTEYCSNVAAMMMDTLATMVDVVQGRPEVSTSLYLNAMILFSVRVLVTDMAFGRTCALVNLTASKGAVSVWYSITSFWSCEEHSSPLLLKPLYRTTQQPAKITFLTCLHVLLEIYVLNTMAPPGAKYAFLKGNLKCHRAVTKVTGINCIFPSFCHQWGLHGEGERKGSA